MMDLIYFALKTQREWDFAVILSGFDYVLKSPHQIEKRLSKHIGFNFLNDDGIFILSAFNQLRQQTNEFVD
jgi:hypothetical protein